MALKIIALCLSAFSLGWCSCSVVYQIMLMLGEESKQSNHKTGNSK